eukprot:gene22211-29274_t
MHAHEHDAGRELSILTWNTSSNLVSHQARAKHQPVRQNREQQGGIAKVIVEHNPDIVCLQELQPRIRPSVADFLLHRGRYLKPEGTKLGVHSHCGYCTILIKSNVGLEFIGGPRAVGPAFLTRLKLKFKQRQQASESTAQNQGGHIELEVASCHLHPLQGMQMSGKTAESNRFKQMQALKVACGGGQGVPPDAYIIAGDMNMRDYEDAKVVNHLGLKDCWVETGRQTASQYSWDTKRNLYYKGGSKYTTRYDRVYFNGTGIEECTSFQLDGEDAQDIEREHTWTLDTQDGEDAQDGEIEHTWTLDTQDGEDAEDIEREHTWTLDTQDGEDAHDI